MRLRVTGTDLFRGAEARVLSSTRRWMQGTLRLYRDTVKELSPVATGRFRRSIYYRTSVRGGEVSGFVGSNLPEAASSAIEEGRKPGKQPPPGALLDWMAARGLDRRLEFVIARRIGERGLPGHFPFARAVNKNRGLLRSRMRDLEFRLGREIV